MKCDIKIIQRRNYFLFGIVLLLFSACNEQKKPLPFTPKELLWTAAYNPTSNQLAFGGNQDSLRIVDADHRTVNALSWPNTITNLKWHPIANKLAIATQVSAQKTALLDIESNTTIELDSISKDGARALGWKPDGSLLAVGDNDGNLSIFDSSGKFLKQYATPLKSITGLSWHPSRNLIACVGGLLALIDSDADTIFTTTTRDSEVLLLCVAWHPEGNFFAIGDYGDSDKKMPALLQFWSAAGKKMQEMERSKAEYRNIVWSATGDTLATASDALRYWSKVGVLLKEKPVENLLWGLDWNYAKNNLVTTDEIGRVTSWDNTLNSNELLKY